MGKHWATHSNKYLPCLKTRPKLDTVCLVSIPPFISVLSSFSCRFSSVHSDWMFRKCADNSIRRRREGGRMVLNFSGVVEGCNNIFENAKTVFISHRFLFYQPSTHTHIHAIHTHNHKNGERFWVSMTSFPESVFCHIPLSLSLSLSLFLSLILSFGHISPLAACVSFVFCGVWACLEGKAQAILKIDIWSRL